MSGNGPGLFIVFLLFSWLSLSPIFMTYVEFLAVDCQDPEDAAVTSDPFGYNKVNGGGNKI